ncbi:MAG: hypothetical protein R6V44_15810 [Paracoccaceae bacterium]
MPDDDILRVEEITDVARRRYRPAHEKLRILEMSPARGAAPKPGGKVRRPLPHVVSPPLRRPEEETPALRE